MWTSPFISRIRPDVERQKLSGEGKGDLCESADRLATLSQVLFPSALQKILTGMAQASVSIAYIAAVANRFPYTADISSNSLVAFGSHKFVSLWNLHDKNIHTTLPGHEGVVTCLRFICGSCFVSGDDRGVLRSWEMSGSQVTLTYLILSLDC